MREWKENAQYLEEKYYEIKAAGSKYALIQINIKNFRYFNTKYGGQQGDEIFHLIFQRLCTILEELEYAAYLYADNFAVLIKYEDTHTLIYERMMYLIDRLYRIEDDRIYRNLFISIGIYQITEEEVSFCDALNYANLCRKESRDLYHRSCCIEVYDENFYNSYMNRLELETRTADAYKNYEFVTYLQPKVDLNTQKIVGAEALLRWFDEDGNNIPLDTFLPILNQNKYIELIDMDTFEQMCSMLDKRIKKNQKVVPISFNISKPYFYEPNLMQDYIRVFEQFHIPKHLIEVELMESITLNDTEYMKKIISELKTYGFTCTLDDFGNGYSSFGVLLNAQLDVIKMDRQFFLDNLNGDAKLIIKTIVDLIHSLNMKVVAEGVERQEHIDFLKVCGCDYVQGYYYYKPMPVDEFEMLLDSKA